MVWDVIMMSHPLEFSWENDNFGKVVKDQDTVSRPIMMVELKPRWHLKAIGKCNHNMVKLMWHPYQISKKESVTNCHWQWEIACDRLFPLKFELQFNDSSTWDLPGGGWLTWQHKEELFSRNVRVQEPKQLLKTTVLIDSDLWRFFL